MYAMKKNQSKQSDIDSIISLFSSGELKKSLEQASTLIKDYPEESILFNIQGACFAGLDQPDAAVKSYEKAIMLKPDYAKAYYNLGGILHEIGNLNESVNSFQKALNIEPNHAEAHNNLGNVLRDLEELDEAAKSFENAINIKPDYIEARYSLAIIFHQTGNLDSIKHLEKIITLKPNFAEAHNILGVELKAVGQLNESVKSYKKAIDINQNYAEAHNNLGNVLIELEHLDDAVQAYRRALAINPDFPTFHNNLGNALRKNGELNNAVKSYQEALTLNNEYADSHNNLGVAFFDLNQLEDALGSYTKAIKINPDYEDALNNLGVVQKKLSLYDEAIKSYQRALIINPDNFETHNNLANIFSEHGRLEDAVKSFKSSIDINPDFEEAHNNLGIAYLMLGRLDDAFKSNQIALSLNSNFAEGYVFQGRLFSEFDEPEKALKSFEIANVINPKLEFNLGSILNMKMDLCDWGEIENQVLELSSKIINNEKSIRPMLLMALSDDPSLQKRAAETYSLYNFPENSILPKLQLYKSHSKIKIGYFSADFKNHPVAALTAGLYELHDRSQFEIHAFSFGPDTKDEMNLRIKAGVDHFHEVSEMSDKDITLLARSFEIDIAIDLGGYTSGSRTGIFAMRAAPIQVNYLGYSGTMGASYIDYLLGDKIIIPECQYKNYSEKIVFLPDSFMVNDNKNSTSSREFSREDLGLPDDSFVFCCFNAHYKITQTVFSSWMKILSCVDGSVLWLSDGHLSAINNLKIEAEKKGIDGNRLIFAPRLDLREDHLSRIMKADLFLDTLPYNAHATTSDALQKGLPVLTCVGKSFASRVAASLLESVELPELVVKNTDDYELLAIELATKPEKLKLIKDKLALKLANSPLYDTLLFTRNIESAYYTMQNRYLKKLDPDHIYVE
jgi:protein O-GlcNAc transferase